jgi:hypothetical protein
LGLRFGRLEVVERVGPIGQVNRPTYRCVCDCGREKITLGMKLRGGMTRSCGCYRRDRAGQLYRKHGLSKTAQYQMFYGARKRAMDFDLPFSIEPDDIVIPDRCPVLGVKFSARGHRDHRPSLDRIKPVLGYVPGNIRVISFRANRIKSDASADELRLVLAYVEASL